MLCGNMSDVARSRRTLAFALSDLRRGMPIPVPPPLMLHGRTPAPNADVGLDDHWQACGSPDAAPGMHYHDAEGSPIVDTSVFPDFKAMTDHAHSLNLTSGWYGNNCDCSDHCRNESECEMQIAGDVKAMSAFNFDAWKLDGCGGETDLVTFNKYMKEAGKPIMVENCHWGRVKPAIPDPSLPPAEGCPWNFYRSSGDVRASYASILSNLATTVPLAQKNLSYPGCWVSW